MHPDPDQGAQQPKRARWGRTGIVGLITLLLLLIGALGGHWAATGPMALPTWAPNVVAAKTCTKTVREPYTAYKTITESYSCTKTVATTHYVTRRHCYTTETRSPQRVCAGYVTRRSCHMAGFWWWRHRVCSTYTVCGHYRTVWSWQSHRVCSSQTVPETRYRTEPATCTKQVRKAYTAYKTVTEPVACPKSTHSTSSSGFGSGNSKGGDGSGQTKNISQKSNGSTNILNARNKTNPAILCRRTNTGRLAPPDPAYCFYGVTYDCNGTVISACINDVQEVRYSCDGNQVVRLTCKTTGTSLNCQAQANNPRGLTQGLTQCVALKNQLQCEAPSVLIGCSAKDPGYAIFQPMTHCVHGVYHPNATFKAGAEKLVQKSACSPPKPGPQCTPQPGVIKTHFEGCSLDKCHEGWFINKNSCGSVEGTQYLSYKASCTAGCPAPPQHHRKKKVCTPQKGVVKQTFEGCADVCHEGYFAYTNSCGTFENYSEGYKASCTAGCVSHVCHPKTLVEFDGCTRTCHVAKYKDVNSCTGKVLSYHNGTNSSCTAGCAVSHKKTPTTPKSTTPTTPKTTGGGSKTTVTVTESKTVTTGALTFEACAPNPKAVAPYGTITVPMTTGGELTAHQYQPTPPIAIWVDVNHVQTVCLATTATCAVYGPNQNIAVVPPQNDNWVTAGDAPVDALLPGPGWAIERQPVTITTIQTTCKTKNGATSCTQQVIGVQSGIQYVETYDPTNCPYLIPVVVPNS